MKNPYQPVIPAERYELCSLGIISEIWPARTGHARLLGEKGKAYKIGDGMLACHRRTELTGPPFLKGRSADFRSAAAAVNVSPVSQAGPSNLRFCTVAPNLKIGTNSSADQVLSVVDGEPFGGLGMGCLPQRAHARAMSFAGRRALSGGFQSAGVTEIDRHRLAPRAGTIRTPNYDEARCSGPYCRRTCEL
jgi:hypothetical protein